MNSSRLKKQFDDDMKIYQIRKSNILPYNGKISIFMLYHDNEKKLVEDIERDLKDRDIIFKNDISEFDSYYDEKIGIFNEVMYMVVLVSSHFLRDWELMEILYDNFDISGANDKIIPIVTDKNIYRPIEKSKILQLLQQDINEYEEQCFDKDYNGDVAEALGRMQKILETIKDFLKFAVNRDKKSNMTLTQKISKYIKYDSGIDLNKENEVYVNKEENFQMKEGANFVNINNNFLGNVNGLQMQQGNQKAVQKLGQDQIDYDLIKNIVEEIRKSDNQLNHVYGDYAEQVRELLSKVEDLAEKKKEPDKIKAALQTLKDLSVGISGSLIASGIVELISNLNI